MASEVIIGISLIAVKDEWKFSIRDCLRVQKPYFYQDGILKIEPKRDKCIDMPENYVENKWHFFGKNKMYLSFLMDTDFIVMKVLLGLKVSNCEAVICLGRFWLCSLLRRETRMHWLVFNYSLKILLQAHIPIAFISSAVPGVQWRLECSQLCNMFCTITVVYWQLTAKDPQKLYKHSSLLIVEDVTWPNQDVGTLLLFLRLHVTQDGKPHSFLPLNTFTAIVDLSRFNNPCLKSPASTLVDLTFQSRALRSALSA